MSRRLLIAIAVVLTFAVACGGDGDAATNDCADTLVGNEVRIDFADGEPVCGAWRQDIALGDLVSVVVSGDRDEQVHVHGYDLYVEPDEDGIEFDALIPGRFEIELEQSGQLLIELTVS